jgi:hypothetical protein
VTTEDQHNQVLADARKKYPDVAADYANLPFDPETTPRMVERMAMTPPQRALADYNEQRGQAAIANANRSRNFTDLVQRANEPGISDDERAARQKAVDDYVAGRSAYGAPVAQIRQQQQQQKDIENDQKQHGVLESQKQKNQALDQSYQSALRKAGVDQNSTDPGALGTDVDDPLKPGKTINAGQAIAQMRAARATAADQAQQQQQIEQRRGWGQFAPKTQSPSGSAPAANTPTPQTAPKPATATQGPPVNLLKEGIPTKFKNGQTWMLKNGQPVQLTPGQ